MVVFLDTSFLMALAIVNDQYHERAVKAAKSSPRPYLTTEAVLFEVGNSLSKQKYKETGFALIQDIINNPEIEILLANKQQFRQALELFGARKDKNWSLTDCLSFVVMDEHGLDKVLTSDNHFVEAGYRALMLE